MVVASLSGTGSVLASNPVGSSEMSPNSDRSVARNLSMTGPCRSMALATRPTAGFQPVDGLRELHEHIGAVRRERPHRGPLLAGGTLGDGIASRHRIRMARDLRALRAGPRLGRDVAEVGGGGARGARVGEAQHRIQQNLLTLRGPR